MMYHLYTYDYEPLIDFKMIFFGILFGKGWHTCLSFSRPYQRQLELVGIIQILWAIHVIWKLHSSQVTALPFHFKLNLLFLKLCGGQLPHLNLPINFKLILLPKMISFSSMLHLYFIFIFYTPNSYTSTSFLVESLVYVMKLTCFFLNAYMTCLHNC